MSEIAINRFCPRSGKPVAPNALAKYKGLTVGFCNPGCRDDFVNYLSERLSDSNYFDVIIKEHQLTAKH